MTDTPQRLPQVGETWTDEYGKKLTLAFVLGDWGLWDWPGRGTALPRLLWQQIAAADWTPPGPPIEWERGLGRTGQLVPINNASRAWRIVKREGQEPTIERVEP